MEPKSFLIQTAMVAVWHRIAYTYAGLEGEVEICKCPYYDTVVKSGYPLGPADERWLAEGHEACYALDVLEDLSVQQHEHYAGCYYWPYRIRNFVYANPR